MGGWVGGCAVEDVTTSHEMHKRGWRSKYLDCCLITGLSPETLSEFFTQRQRWVAGSGQLLIYRFSLFSSDMPLSWRVAYIVGAWYWILMLVIIVFVVVRMGLWFAFHTVKGEATKTWLPLLSEYVPTYFMFLFLPVLSLEAKLVSIIAVFTFIPTYFAVTWGWIRGRLNPAKFTYRVKGSAEAVGDKFPTLAWYNVGFLFLITTFFALTTIPSFKIYQNALDWVVPIVFVVWCYIVNLPVVYDGLRRVFKAIFHGLRFLAMPFRMRQNPAPHAGSSTEPPV
jgi:cellulose synthase/poly-beta-1,6-N-acetylglucosamine synthase-like glycosyltransferase